MSAKFVYFDAGGVLFHYRDSLREMADKHKLHYSDFERVFRKHDDQVVKGFITPQQLWEYYQRELGFSEPGIDYLDYWVSKLTPITETHQLILDLTESGFQLGLITNLYSGVFEKALKYGQIPDVHYAAVIQSGEVHMMKPEPQIYRYAQELSKTDPQNILFIDDKADFLTPAKSLNWQTFLFNEINPDESVRSLRKLLLY